jgi:uncharacterized protein involved in exopolysaccharide biosynthesis
MRRSAGTPSTLGQARRDRTLRASYRLDQKPRERSAGNVPMDVRQMPPREETGPRPARTAELPVLADYVTLAWRFKALLVAAAVVGGVAMFARSVTGPRVYESTVTFAATQSKIGEGSQAVASTAAFRPMIESLTTAAAVIHAVGLDKPPRSMRPSEFLAQVMSVSEVRGTSLMRVTVVYTDPALAATMANSVASHAVQVARDVSADEAVHARDMIKAQLELARKRLDGADARLRSFRQEAQVEAVRKDVDAQLEGRRGLLELVVTIASEKAKLARMEQDLASRPRVDTLTKTIDSEPALRGASGSGAAGAQLRSESVNEVYRGMDTEAAATRANLASLEKQRTELMDVRKLGAAKLAALNHLYEIEGELDRRQIELDLAQKIYTDISQRYEVASLQVVGRSAELSVIDPAVPADRPVPRQVARNTVVGAVIGLCFGLAGVLLWQAAVRTRRVPVR